MSELEHRTSLEQKLQERLRFEELLSDLSATFVNLPADHVDQKINDGLRRLGENLRVDLGTVILFNEEEASFQVTHEWVISSITSDPNFRGIIVDDKYPWLARQLVRQEPVSISQLDDFPAVATKERKACEEIGIKSVLWVPFNVPGSVLGYVAFNTIVKRTTWSHELIQRIRLVGEIFANALARQGAQRQLQEAFSEIERLKDRLERENIYLREEIAVNHKHDEVVGQSDAIRKVLSQVEQVAETNATVLLLGETGTGKELLARSIHNLSPRKGRPMIKVNCAGLPATLVESELFGREKGAYTGALTRQIGRFEVADGSTIFLDEISELSLELQAKLLRVLQEGQFERLGSSKTLKVNVRVIAATNRDLAKAVSEGKFREDLYYRLNVFPISVPPLRARREDVPLLVWTFIKEFGEIMGKNIHRVPRKTMDALQAYPWPGNVREVRNVIERAMILCEDATLRVELPAAREQTPFQGATLAELERKHISEVLERTGWRVRGRSGAAAILGLKPTTLEARIKKLGIRQDQ
jgi:transcriptional regulator with GAF, ATPase, and Fis domain